MMNTWAAGFTGISIVSTQTFIDQCNVTTGALTRYSAPIPAGTPIDPINNVYNITVQVNARVEPLFRASSWFAGVQGLTSDFPVQVTCAAMAEKPGGFRN